MSGADDSITAFLSTLLADASRNGCDCEPCRTLRRAWVRLGLPEPPPSVPMCGDCASHPRGEAILRGAVGTASIGPATPRCVLCGMPLETAAGSL